MENQTLKNSEKSDKNPEESEKLDQNLEKSEELEQNLESEPGNCLEVPKSSDPPILGAKARSLPNISLSPHILDDIVDHEEFGKRKYGHGKLFLRTWAKVKRLLHKEKKRRKSLDDGEKLLEVSGGSARSPGTPSPAYSFREIEKEIRRNYEELQKRLSDELHPHEGRGGGQGGSRGSSKGGRRSAELSGREMWKLSTGQVTMTDEEVLKIVPGDFSKKLLEWETIKGFGNQLSWVERQLEKVGEERRRLERDLEECKEREFRLLSMRRDLRSSTSSSTNARTPLDIVERDKFELFEAECEDASASEEEGLTTEDSFAKSNTDSELIGGGSGTGSRRRSSGESSVRSPSSAFDSDDEPDGPSGLLRPVAEEESPPPPPQILRVKPVHLLDGENDVDSQSGQLDLDEVDFDSNLAHSTSSSVFVPTKRTIFTPVSNSDDESGSVPTRNYIQTAPTSNLPPQPPPRPMNLTKLPSLDTGWHLDGFSVDKFLRESNLLENPEEPRDGHTVTYSNPASTMSTSYGNFRRIPLSSPGFVRRKIVKPSTGNVENFCLARSNSFQGSSKSFFRPLQGRHLPYNVNIRPLEPGPSSPPPLPLSRPPPLPERGHNSRESPPNSPLINFGNPLMGSAPSVSKSKSTGSIRKMGRQLVGLAKGLFNKTPSNENNN